MEGIFAIVSPDDCIVQLYDSVFRLQHRGQGYCGIATASKRGIKMNTRKGLVTQTLEEGLSGLRGNMGIGFTGSHFRQPVFRYTRHGDFSFAFNGLVMNRKEVTGKLLKQGFSFSTLEDSELLAVLIAQEKSIFDGIKSVMETVQGPKSLVVLTKEGVYAARGPLGRKPLVLGEGKNCWCVASESCAFANNEVKITRDLSPGEIIFITNSQPPQSRIFSNEKSQFCCFEWIYFGRPDSVIDGMSVAKARQNLGKFLAEKDNVEADEVAPVPFSGICHAEGYHLASGLPSVEIFLLPQYIRRTYIMELVTRQKEKDKKLLPLQVNVAGKRLIVVDDSIRSGITMRGLVGDLKAAGAKEVHVRIASPLSIRNCPFDTPAKKGEKYIASYSNVEQIRQFIEADSLMFQDLENVSKAIGIPSELLCLGCFL